MQPILVALVAALYASCTADAETAYQYSSDQPQLHATCPSATINYITQTLPQQCLRTDWSRTAGLPHGSVSTDSDPTEIAARGGLNDEGPTTTATQTSSSDGASVTPAASTAETVLDEQGQDDSDPLSDQGNFLSFEEWKAQVLEKAGQSPDHVVGTAGAVSGGSRRRAPGISNALDSLGDEGEIELDFSGFVNPGASPNTSPENSSEAHHGADHITEDTPAPPTKRSKDAGTTSNERFNYASFDCAATVLKTNQGSKGAIRILSENKDSYLINKCAESEKYFIVELCNDILIDTIVLGNFEFFSSTFRTFRVSISDRYPVKAEKWREIGTFEARNTRGVQAFMVEDGLIWARYLKVELLTHYGKEYYCPVSLLRVHGTTMMDDYRNEMKDPQDQDDDEEENTSIVERGDVAAPAEVIPIAPIKAVEKEATELPETGISVSTISDENTGIEGTAPISSQEPQAHPTASPQVSSLAEPSDPTRPTVNSCETDETITAAQIVPTTPLPTAPPTLDENGEQTQILKPEASSEVPPVVSSDGSFSSPLNATMSIPLSAIAAANTSSDSLPIAADANVTSSLASPQAEVNSPTTGSLTSVIEQTLPSDSSVPSGSTTETINSQTQNQTNSQGTIKAQNATVVGTKTKSKASSPIKASLATPSTQDSFFRSVHKRLQMLEANSTLSLQYIEEQSRILRDAFAKAEKKQIQKTSKFLETLNSTVLEELQNIRVQYDQLWQSTVLELAGQKQQNQQELRALGERLGLLADQMVWMERMLSLASFLTILCLGLVIFVVIGLPGGTGVPLEPDLLQSIQHLRRGVSSVSFSKQYPSYVDSDPGTPSRPTSMGGLFGRNANHRRNASDGITSGDEATNPTSSPEQHRSKRLHVRMSSDATTLTSGRRSKSPSVSFGVDTPSSEHDEVLNNASGAEEEIEVPEADPAALKRAASSPPLGRLFEVPTDDEMSSSGPGDIDLNERR